MHAIATMEGPPSPFLATEERLTGWAELADAIAGLDGGWVFRGVLHSAVPETGLERACRSWQVPPARARDLERVLTRDFLRHPESRRRAQVRGWLETRALMQHHGAPTRLLDWTYSPYVAAFFAYDAFLHARGGPASAGAAAAGERPAIWAIHTGSLHRALVSLLSDDDYRAVAERRPGSPAFVSVVDRDPPVALIAPANPYVLNARLSVQQGVFLCPGDVTRSWLENLAAMPWQASSRMTRSWTLDIEPGHVFEQLSRMNVTARSLFPGMDGFARSMLHRADLLMALAAPDEPPSSAHR